MRHLWWVHWDSANFRFDAFGATKVDALAALRSALDQHTREYRLEDAGWADGAEDDAAWSAIPIRAGARVRDHEIMRDA